MSVGECQKVWGPGYDRGQGDSGPIYGQGGGASGPQPIPGKCRICTK